MLLSSTSCFIMGFRMFINLDSLLFENTVPAAKLKTFVPVVEFISTSTSNLRFLVKGEVQLSIKNNRQKFVNNFTRNFKIIKSICKGYLLINNHWLGYWNIDIFVKIC